jgi:hypothetical protein
MPQGGIIDFSYLLHSDFIAVLQPVSNVHPQSEGL